MNKAQDKFWDWATRGAIRFGTVLLVAHTILTAPLRKRSHHG